MCSAVPKLLALTPFEHRQQKGNSSCPQTHKKKSDFCFDEVHWSDEIVASSTVTPGGLLNCQDTLSTLNSSQTQQISQENRSRAAAFPPRRLWPNIPPSCLDALICSQTLRPEWEGIDVDSAASMLIPQHKHCASCWCRSHQINSSKKKKMCIFPDKVHSPSLITEITHCMQVLPEIIHIYLGRWMIMDSLQHSIATGKYQKNIHPRYGIGRQFIPSISLNSIRHMDIVVTSSLGLCARSGKSPKTGSSGHDTFLDFQLKIKL